MACDCNNTKGNVKYKISPEGIIKKFVNGQPVTRPKDMAEVVQDIVNNNCCDFAFCGRYYKYSEDGSKRFRLSLDNEGTATWVEVDTTTCEDVLD